MTYVFKRFGKKDLKVISNPEKKEVFDYYESLYSGKKSEKEFINKFCVKLEESNEWDFDFYMPTPNGLATVELKSDNYKRSPNFAMETIRDIELNTPGGPWQSKAKYFIYSFKNQNKYYLFETSALVELLNNLLTKKAFKRVRTTTVKNGRTYQTESLLIPIKLLESVGIKLSEEHIDKFKTKNVGTLTNGYFPENKSQDEENPSDGNNKYQRQRKS